MSHNSSCTKSTNPVILSVTHQCQNPSGSSCVLKYVEFRTMDKVLKPCDSERATPPPEPFRFYMQKWSWTNALAVRWVPVSDLYEMNTWSRPSVIYRTRHQHVTAQQTRTSADKHAGSTAVCGSTVLTTASAGLYV
jgi:hypothetical protein